MRIIEVVCCSSRSEMSFSQQRSCASDYTTRWAKNMSKNWRQSRNRFLLSFQFPRHFVGQSGSRKLCSFYYTLLLLFFLKKEECNLVVKYISQSDIKLEEVSEDFYGSHLGKGEMNKLEISTYV